MDADLLKLVIFPVAFIALMAIIKIGGLFFRKSEPRDWTEGEGNSLVTMRLASFDDAGGPPRGTIHDVALAQVNWLNEETLTINPATNLPMVSAAFDVAGNPFGFPPALHTALFDGEWADEAGWHINPATGIPMYPINPATNLPMLNTMFDIAGNPFGSPSPLESD
ncbi:hypothetical protein [Burkholderia sp. BCC1985]|uniref:hypothetical protein n=1 Tax=Burkholderia sp. BCC1985 TaxID=2817442 RepID=UPI002AB068F6|nr:hypothetical protein [Burkholderia sp. BCC1985]